MERDLHGYRPRQLFTGDVFTTYIRQVWETGAEELTLIHGHARKRDKHPGFVNTNTSYLGLEVRRALRHDVDLRVWIKPSTLDCSDPGVTRIRLKRNPQPTRGSGDIDALPEPEFPPRYR
jgi:hypothetical protein